MIDTVKLKSPPLPECVAVAIENALTKRLGLKLGELLYELTSDTLSGSFDNKIMVSLRRDEIVDDPVKRLASRETYPKMSGHKSAHMLRPCEPYLVIEGSVHKAMLGHNITEGPLNFQPSCAWFVDLLASLLDVELPCFATWHVLRVDWTECFTLPYRAISEFIFSMTNCEYSKRKARRYGSETIMFPGQTTTLKFYHKGPEFHSNGRRVLRDLMSPQEIDALQELANGIMRVELSIKSKKLRQDLGTATVDRVHDEYLMAMHDYEVARVLREGKTEMETVRTALDVQARLNEYYNTARANTLYGVWTQLATVGENPLKEKLPKATFYKYRKFLVEAGVSWAGTDVILRESFIPAGFSLRRSEPRRVTTEHPEIVELLKKYREAA